MIKFVLALVVMCSVLMIEKTGNLKYGWISLAGILTCGILIILESLKEKGVCG